MKHKMIYIAVAGVASVFVFLVAIGEETSGSPAGSAAPLHAGAPREHIGPAAESLASLPAQAPLPAGEAPPNITEEVSKQIAEELILRNPEGPSVFEGVSGISTRDPETLIADILEEQLSNIKPEEFRAPVALAELNVVGDSREEIETFSRRYRAAIAPFVSLGLSAQGSPEYAFSPLARAAEEAVAALRALPVPSRIAPQFAKELELVQLHRNIFTAVARTEHDPFRASVALQILWPSAEEFDAAHRAFSRILTSLMEQP